jgi:uncharacterized protein (UPF0276 family)
MISKFNAPLLGFGLGLRSPHYDEVMQDKPDVGWFEIISDNYLNAHKGYWDYLSELRSDYPLVMHGVSLSIGGVGKIDVGYLRKLKELAQVLEPSWISDHLCYSCIQKKYSHDLLPIPYTEEALGYVIPRIHKVQEAVGRPFVFENASSYVEFDGSTLSEPEFLTELVKRTGCGILLDVNNVYVSSHNHGWDAKAYIDAIPADSIAQYHLAGHTHQGKLIIDTHNDYVADPVWDLYHYTLKTKGMRSTMIEWDDNIPPFSVLMEELNRARDIAAQLDKVAVEKILA